MACVVREKKGSEGDKNKKVDGEVARKRENKNDKSDEKRGCKKMKCFLRDGPRKDRPLTPTKKALRPALWTNSTSGKVLDVKPSNTFALIPYVGTLLFLSAQSTTKMYC